jgi:hypothetical protein
MFFCNECQYLFNITRDIKNKQVGGKVNIALNKIFEKFNKNEEYIEDDFKKITGKDILEDERYDSMSKKNQRKLTAFIKNFDKNFFVENPEEKQKIGVNKAYFICKFCKNHREIKPGTLIYAKSYLSLDQDEADNYELLIHDATLPRTKNYLCKNKKCKTYQDPELKEAIIYKKKERLTYICYHCGTHWNNEI